MFQIAHAEEEPESVYYEELDLVEAKYRSSKAKMILKASRVVIYLVDFEGSSETDLDPFSDKAEAITVIDYERKADVLLSKELDAKQRKNLLGVLSKQIAKPKHGGGAMCHYPIHGIRIYDDNKILHEGTFCWVCKNFSYNYPRSSSWLDTTPELEKIFNDLMPIPQKELDRFHNKHPQKKTKLQTK